MDDDTDEKDINGTMKVATREATKVPLSMSAYIVNIFFFFQVATLIHIEIPNPTGDDAESIFQQNLFRVVNFKLAVSRQLCPMDDLTLPQKRMINVALKLCSIFNLVIFLFCWKCAAFFKNIFLSCSHDEEELESIELKFSIDRNDTRIESRRFNSFKSRNNGESESIEPDPSGNHERTNFLSFQPNRDGSTKKTKNSE